MSTFHDAIYSHFDNHDYLKLSLIDSSTTRDHHRLPRLNMVTISRVHHRGCKLCLPDKTRSTSLLPMLQLQILNMLDMHRSRCQLCHSSNARSIIPRHLHHWALLVLQPKHTTLQRLLTPIPPTSKASTQIHTRRLPATIPHPSPLTQVLAPEYRMKKHTAKV